VRTRLILRAWDILKRLWTPFKPLDEKAIRAEAERVWRETGGKRTDLENWQAAEVALRAKALAACVSESAMASCAACAEEIDHFFPGTPDPVLQRWRFLLAEAAELDRPSGLGLRSDAWQQLAPWPLAHVPALWSSEEAKRKQAAELLASATETAKMGWNEEQRLLLQALAAWVTEKDDTYIERYSCLEPLLADLPIHAADLWCRAAMIWFKQERWNEIVERELPDCIADLSDPRMRLLMGLAYSQSAVETAKNDVRGALVKVRQARSTLQELLTK
jgi:hypothetical protein